jgi:hypothetical protein
LALYVIFSTSLTRRFQKTKTVIERGYEQWALGDRKMGLVDARDVFITKLVNCGGSHWQMELWIPKRNVPTAYGY